MRCALILIDVQLCFVLIIIYVRWFGHVFLHELIHFLSFLMLLSDPKTVNKLINQMLSACFGPPKKGTFELGGYSWVESGKRWQNLSYDF